MESRKSRRREHILSAAERLFQHYGFAKTTVADIARAAEVGVGTVYLEFNSKAAIASELSLRRYDCMLAAMREVASAEGSFADRLQHMFAVKLDWLTQFADAGPHGQELVRGACRATNLAHADFWDAQAALLGEFLHAGVLAGEFEIAEPLPTARVLLRVLQVVTSPPESNLVASSESNLVDSNYLESKAAMAQMRADITAAYQLLLHGLLRRKK